MTMTTHEVDQVLKLIAASYPSQRQRMSNDDVRAMAAAYRAGLLDLDSARVRTAVDRLVKSSRFMPSIAEIRAAVVEVEHGARRGGLEAWADVTREARRICALSEHDVIRDPSLAKPQLDDQIAIAAARTLGWDEIRDRRVGDVSTRARFIELYDQLSAREHKEAAIALGATSRALPQRTTEARRIGDIETVRGLLPEGESK